MAKRLLPPVTLLLVVAAFFWKLISGQYVWFETGGDVVFQVLPWLQMQAAALHSGQFPLWDPYQFGGQPLLGQVQPGLLNPFHYLLLAPALISGHVSVLLFSRYFVLLHGLAAVAAFLLFRDAGLGARAAWLGALFYGIGGVAGNAGWPQVVCGMIFPPLVLLFLLRSHRGVRPDFSAAVAGMLVGLSWFSGHHSIPILLTVALPVSLAVLVLISKEKRGLMLRRYTICLIVAALVSAPQTWAAVEFSEHSMRWVGLDHPVPGSERIPYSVHSVFNVRPTELLNLLFAGDLSADNPFAGWLFVGITGLLCCALAVKRFAEEPLVRLFTILALAAMLFAMGRYNVLHGVAYWLVPFVEKLREPVFALTIFQLGMAGLIAFGADQLLRGETAASLRIWVRALAILAVLVALTYMNLRVFAGHGQPDQHASDDALMMTGLVAALLAGLLALHGRQAVQPTYLFACLAGLLLIEQGNVSGHSPQTRLVSVTDAKVYRQLADSAGLAAWLRGRPDLVRMDANRDDLGLNAGDWLGLEELSGYSPAVYAPIAELGWWRPSVRRLYGVNYYLARTPAYDGQPELYTGVAGIKIFANPGACPRAWVIHQLLPVMPGTDLSGVLDKPGVDLSKTAFVEGTPPALETCDSAEQVHITERRLNSVAISAVLGCRGLVVLSDNNYPGWRATVDDHPAPIYSPYLALRGVVVESGSHHIEMWYRPASVYVGFLLSLVGFMLVGILAAAG